MINKSMGLIADWWWEREERISDDMDEVQRHGCLVECVDMDRGLLCVCSVCGGGGGGAEID